MSYVRVVCSLIFWLQVAQVTSWADTFVVCSLFSSAFLLITKVVFTVHGLDRLAFFLNDVEASLSVLWPSSSSSSMNTCFMLINFMIISLWCTISSLTDLLPDELASSRLLSVYFRFALLFLVLAAYSSIRKMKLT